MQSEILNTQSKIISVVQQLIASALAANDFTALGYLSDILIKLSESYSYLKTQTSTKVNTQTTFPNLSGLENITKTNQPTMPTVPTTYSWGGDRSNYKVDGQVITHQDVKLDQSAWE